MPREPQDVTEAELALLEKLWDAGRASIRQLTDAIYPGGGAARGMQAGWLSVQRHGVGECGRVRQPKAAA